MKTMKAGVWIDHKKATVVLVTEEGKEIKKVTADSEEAVRFGSDSLSRNTYRPNDFVAEDKHKRKVANHRMKFYDEVLACVSGAASIFVLGPGGAKGEFIKRIKSKKLRDAVVELETTDKMTDRQLAVKVQQHFATDQNGKSAPRKKVVAKKAAPVKRGNGSKNSKRPIGALSDEL